MGAEPAALALGSDKRYLLQGFRPEHHRPLARRQEAQLVHLLGPHLRAEQRILHLADRHAILPDVRCRRGSRKRLNWPDPYFTFYAEASYERYNLKNWTGFVVENGNSNLLSLETRLRPQLRRPAHLSAPRFGVQRLGAGHAPLLALGRQGLLRPVDERPGPLPLDRVPQVAVQGPVVPGIPQQLEPRADAQGRDGIPRQLQQKQGLALPAFRSRWRRHDPVTTSTVSTSSPCAVTKTAPSTPNYYSLAVTTSTPPSCDTRSS